MFSPGFRLPGADTDAAAHAIVAFARNHKHDSKLSSEQGKEIFPAIQALERELVGNPRLNIMSIDQDKDVIVTEALNTATREMHGGGLKRLNEFWVGREFSRLRPGTTVDPYVLEFISEHALQHHAEACTLKPTQALKNISDKISIEGLKDSIQSTERALTAARARTPMENTLFAGPVRHEDEVADAIMHSYFKRYNFSYYGKYLEDFSRQKNADISSLSKRLTALNQEYTKSNDAEIIKKTADTAREALLRASVARFHALALQVIPVFLRKAEASRAYLANQERNAQADEYREVGFSGDALTKQMEMYDADRNLALRNMQITDTSHAASAKLVETISKSMGLHANQISDAFEKTMSKATTSRNINTSETNRILSKIYDATKSKPKGNKGEFSSKLRDTYRFMKTIKGGEEILATGYDKLMNSLT